MSTRRHAMCLLLVLSACTGDPDTPDPLAAERVTVTPDALDEVLVNPGMGVANFHFGWWCDLPPVTFSAEACAERVLEHWPENYPDAGTAYFRWTWAQLEPQPGQLDLAMIDATLQGANALNETLGIRVYAIDEGGWAFPRG